MGNLKFQSHLDQSCDFLDLVIYNCFVCCSTASVSVVITGLGPDFTKMESFGKVEAFAETLVGSSS